ncbi:MAG TPA: DUF1572 family protein [Ignavibacteria bacterium]|nr:DUF1572 family protein [Ignavibacteria bacterium]HQY53080.1 DUF1572 family protein [Ignavibacteria bacterium]HRB00662.1 DUF1572 family protein [Ignavibacteria bacterium]
MDKENLGRHYLENVRSEFRKLKSLGDNTFKQIKDEEFFLSPDEESNSIAIIVRHMSGNMLSRWTDFLTTDGEKEFRKRDEEFDKLFYTDKDDIILRWENGWECFFKTLDSLTEDDLLKYIKIRNESHTVTEALNRQLTHYAYHIGQIVYLAKHILNKNWNSLSIPKGKSDEFNKKMGM